MILKVFTLPVIKILQQLQKMDIKIQVVIYINDNWMFYDHITSEIQIRFTIGNNL